MMTLSTALSEIIPSRHDEFQKLMAGDPYRFDSWDTDKHGNACLYYWFYSRDGSKKNRKRVVTPEIERLLRHKLRTGESIIVNSEFKAHCPATISAGSCGYAVTVRLLEYLGVGRYLERRGVQIVDEHRMRRVIEGLD